MAWASVALALALALVPAVLAGATPLRPPEYPLFSITNREADVPYTQPEVRAIASTYRFSDGLPPNASLLAAMRLAGGGSFASVRYCNPRGVYMHEPLPPGDNATMSLRAFEARHRSEATWYTAGWLNTSVDEGETTLMLDHPLSHGTDPDTNHCARRSWLLVPSNTAADYSAPAETPGGPVQFVAYVRVDDELMKLTAVAGDQPRNQSQCPFSSCPPPPARLRLVRAFGGSTAARHLAGARVLAPVLLDQGFAGRPTDMAIAVSYSPASSLSHEILANRTLGDRAAGYDGPWLDNFGPSLFNGHTATGCSLRTHELYEAEAGRAWNLTRFMDAQQARFERAMSAVQRKLGLSLRPPAVANGYGGFRWPAGECQVRADASAPLDCESFAAAKEALRGHTGPDGRVAFPDGYIMEGFFGHQVFQDGGCCRADTPAQAADCLSRGRMQWKDADDWLATVQALAAAAQSSPPMQAYPIVAQAGCKSTLLELVPAHVRDQYEQGAYASFLLAVEARDGPLALGINTMYRKAPQYASRVDTHPRFFWPVGEPAESHPPGDFAKYALPPGGTGGVGGAGGADRGPEGVARAYGRRFSNGFAAYNPSNATGVEAVRLPGGPYIDPATNESVVTLDLQPQTGYILIKEW